MLKKTVTYPGFEGDELVDKKKDIYFDIDIISAAKLMGSGFEKKLSSVQTRAQEIENAVKTKTMDENEGNVQLLEMFSDIFEPFFEVAYNERRGDDLVNKDEDGTPLFKKFMSTKGYTAPATPAYNNNLVNTGVILGTAALTLAAGTGLYFGLAKLTKVIKERLNKKNEPTEEAPAEKEEPNKADED